MAQHISIRVLWHDNVWNGCICNEPTKMEHILIWVIQRKLKSGKL